MDCGVCGKENVGQVGDCAYCGAELVSRCFNCGSSLPAGARFCPACGLAVEGNRPDASSGSARPANLLATERKIITVLFADFANFTLFVRANDPEVVHDWLGSFWSEVDAIITAYDGSVSKHIGDAVMALFGHKNAREDAPAQAVRAGLAIQACLGRLEAKGFRSRLRLRIGIHVGVAVLEPLSSSGEFRATGDAINLASRLEESAPAGRVLISHEVFRCVYGLFDLEPVKPLVLKGVHDPVKAYLVGGAKPRAVARQLRDIEGVSTEMVNRQAELRALQAVFHRVMRQKCGELVTVLGDAGIGKSRLLQEFQHWAELSPERFWFFLGQATADMPSTPLALVRDAFASRFEIRDSDPPAFAREKLEQGIVSMLSHSDLAANWPAQEHRQIAHFIGHALGLDFSGSPHVRALLRDPEQLRARAMHGLRRFFTALGHTAEAMGIGGVLLVAEDIHWSDPGSLAVLEDLAVGADQVPLMVLCLARPTLLEQRPGWGAGVPRHSIVRLESLSVEESRTLVRTILRKAVAVPAALRDLVTDLAEGNPFYIEELIRMLIDQKVISPGPERWEIQPLQLGATRVPQTLAGVLQARLNGLSPAERAVMQRAAVVGRVFWDRALQAIGSAEKGADPLGKLELSSALESLRRKELILCREGSAFANAAEYSFKHELLRNAAYEGLLKAFRRDFHAQVAVWLIEQSRERSAEFAPQVAAHFEEAGRQLEAAEWYGRAGKQARAGHEPAMAIEHLQKALKLLPPNRTDHQQDLLEWLCCLMESFCDQARFEEARDLAVKIQRRAELAGDWVSQARAWNGLAFLHERQAANHDSVAAARKAELLARKAGPAGIQQQLRAMHLRGWACYRLANWDAVLEVSRETQVLCMKWGDLQGLAASYKLQGVVHLQRGDTESADRCFEEGLNLCQEFGDRRNAAAMLSNLGESARLRGDFAAAVEYYEKALAISRQIGNRASEAIYISNLSGARLGLRQYAQAEAALRHIIPLATTRTSSMLAEAFSFLSEACLGQGKTAEAVVAARRAVDLGKGSGNELDTAIGWRVLGEAEAALQVEVGGDKVRPVRSRRIAPAQCFSRSLRLFAKMNAEAEQARTLRAWGKFERSCGHEAHAHERLKQAVKIFARLRMSREVEATVAVLNDGRTSARPHDAPAA